MITRNTYGFQDSKDPYREATQAEIDAEEEKLFSCEWCGEEVEKEKTKLVEDYGFLHVVDEKGHLKPVGCPKPMKSRICPRCDSEKSFVNGK